MHITRLQVEEGFLDGLDLSFDAGLNVVMGARGTGKTSLIELIRFCFGVPGLSEDVTKRSNEHARAILGSGQVTVTVSVPGRRDVIVSRTSSELVARSSEFVDLPTIFSQTEIETLGLSPISRLRLIDGFIPETARLKDQENELTAHIRSVSLEIANQRSEIDSFERDLAILPELDQSLTELAPRERAMMEASAAWAKRSDDLQKLTVESSRLSVRSAQLNRIIQALKQWHSSNKAAFSAGKEAIINIEPDSGELDDIRTSAKSILDGSALALAKIEVLVGRANAALQATETARLEVEAKTRSMRQEIDFAQKGAGALARQIQVLKEQKAQVIAVRDLLDRRRRKLAELNAVRSQLLDDLDHIRQQHFDLRASVAKVLNKKLGPRIKVEIERSGQVGAYAGALATLLRGSGIRYNELSQVFAKFVSPRELLEWAESDNVDELANAARIPRDRAARALVAFREANTSELAVLSVNDDAKLFLLDGSDYKPISLLSTGQRCTTILPIIMEQREAVLIVDQPEDHIDNAFIVDTLVKAITDRAEDGQLIISTHNANIPVLGGASRVTQMGSDGRRGFVVHTAPLADAHTVDAITKLMEGGREAFSRRAAFYGRHAVA